MVRHGQASFGQTNYDKLSPLGEQQARVAGVALRNQNLGFDMLVAGSMDRQQVTAQRVAEAFENPPALQTRPAFNEYDADALFGAYLPQVLAEDAELAANKQRLFSDRRLFQTAFARTTRLWLAGAPNNLEHFETWLQFRERVRDGLAELHHNAGRDARIALCTSGGPIAVAAGSALGASDHSIMQMNWTVYNASFTEFSSHKTGWRLMGFNNISHLRGRDNPLVTHR